MSRKPKEKPEGNTKHELEVSLTVQKRLTSFHGRLPSRWLLVLALIVLARFLPDIWGALQSVWALVGWR
ncbi:MAG TPA: hypothetical protein PLC98_13625 [Anaerolineales bacterium]|nr:hypothetical protein [Anaerolineales bacterium]